ncbi:Retrotransposon gag protein [Popillia japonica]|uniref:Retrotransposon gag protein n=1 Tax=Popillia japonica TaxID=7064 RepID=A0AAW1LLY2_POPJA
MSTLRNPILPKFVGPPKFDPSQHDAVNFLKAYTSAAEYNARDDNLKLCYFPNLMTGSAEDWFRSFAKRNPNAGWLDTLHEFKVKFIGSRYADELEIRLVTKKQKPDESIRDYFYNTLLPYATKWILIWTRVLLCVACYHITDIWLTSVNRVRGIEQCVSLLYVLEWLLVPVGSTEEMLDTTGYTVQTMEHTPGLLHQDLGNIHLIKLFCRVISYIDLGNYENQFLLIKENLNEIRQACVHNHFEITLLCDSHVKTLIQTLQSIEQEKNLIHSLVGKNRVKRGYIDVVGGIEQCVSLLYVLEWLLVPVGSTEEMLDTTGYTVQTMEHTPGLLHQDLGNIHLIKLFCRVISYIDLGNYENQFLLIKENLNEIRQACVHNHFEITLLCDSHVKTLIQTLQSIEQEKNLIHSLVGKNRVKRGYIDVVGKISKTLFGTLTTEDAEQFEPLISDLSQKQIEGMQILKQQTSIIKSTIDSVNSTLGHIERNEKIIELNINNLGKAYNSTSNAIKTLSVLSLLHRQLSTHDDTQNLLTERRGITAHEQIDTISTPFRCDLCDASFTPQE